MRRLWPVLLALLGLTLLAAAPASAAIATQLENRTSGSPSGSNNLVGIDPRLSENAVRENVWLGYEGASGSPVAARAGASAFGSLSRAGQYGIRSYSELTKALKGTGLQAHHLIEQRFAGVLGQNARQGLSVAVTQAEHQAFTNAWRSAIPYGAGTANATEAQIMNAARQIYADYPQILNALGL